MSKLTLFLIGTLLLGGGLALGPVFNSEQEVNSFWFTISGLIAGFGVCFYLHCALKWVKYL